VAGLVGVASASVASVGGLVAGVHHLQRVPDAGEVEEAAEHLVPPHLASRRRPLGKPPVGLPRHRVPGAHVGHVLPEVRAWQRLRTEDLHRLPEPHDLLSVS
jgi:hypothetical protein